jgi:hypothetical protein
MMTLGSTRSRWPVYAAVSGFVAFILSLIVRLIG